MGLLEKFKKKNTKKKHGAAAANILVEMMKERIYTYPHNYFIQKAPKHFNFIGR